MMTTRLILVLPHHLGRHSDESVVGSGRQVMEELSQRSSATVLETPPLGSDFALSCLGLNPEAIRITPGGLRSFGARFETGPRSIFFAVDLLSLTEEGVLSDMPVPNPDETRWLEQNLPRLATKRLEMAFLGGKEGTLHWREGSLEHATRTPSDVFGKVWHHCLPEGDGETLLRQFIDDSANLLLEAEFNRIRVLEGIEPISAAWPWGAGPAARLPNLPMELGLPVSVASDDPAVLKLAEIAGARAADLGNVWKAPPRLALQPGLNVMVYQAFVEGRRFNRVDRMEELWQRITQSVVQEFLLLSEIRPRSITIVGTKEDGDGLAVTWNSEVSLGDRVPYHERVFGDTQVPKKRLWDFIHALSRS